MMKKNKKKEEQPGDQPRASKRKIQQSAPLASGVSVPEKAKKPKGVAAEAAPCPPEVAKGTTKKKCLHKRIWTSAMFVKTIILGT